MGVNLQHSAKNVFCPGGRRCGAEKDLACLHEGDCAPVTTRFQYWDGSKPGIPLRTIEIVGIYGCSSISIDHACLSYLNTMEIELSNENPHGC